MKEIYVLMSYSTFGKWLMAATAVGAGLMWALTKWEKSYDEARDAGVVA